MSLVSRNLLFFFETSRELRIRFALVGRKLEDSTVFMGWVLFFFSWRRAGRRAAC